MDDVAALEVTRRLAIADEGGRGRERDVEPARCRRVVEQRVGHGRPVGGAGVERQGHVLVAELAHGRRPLGQPGGHEALRVAAGAVGRRHQPHGVVALPDGREEVAGQFRRHGPQMGHAAPRFGVVEGEDGPVGVGVEHNRVARLPVG